VKCGKKGTVGGGLPLSVDKSISNEVLDFVRSISQELDM